jgi:hypothetical protein
MSVARSRFHTDIAGIADAVSLELVAAGVQNTSSRSGVIILRRGILIASLIALETFIRDRTTELLADLGQWPARFEDLPQRIRDAALFDALSHLQSFARVLKRQQLNYEAEIIVEVDKMASNRGPAFAFSKFVSGDHTGNISDGSVKELLKTFQVDNCWPSLRTFSAEIGFGVPSVQQIVADIVGKRHRSAHAAGFVPTASDIAELPQNLTCIGVCFDAAMTGSVVNALNHWRDWTAGTRDWRSALEIFLVQPSGNRYRILRPNSTRAIAVVEATSAAPARLPARPQGKIALLVERDVANLPRTWHLLP